MAVDAPVFFLIVGTLVFSSNMLSACYLFQVVRSLITYFIMMLNVANVTTFGQLVLDLMQRRVWSMVGMLKASRFATVLHLCDLIRVLF